MLSNAQTFSIVLLTALTVTIGVFEMDGLNIFAHTQTLTRQDQCPLFGREESAERCQYYGEKLVGFGSKIPKSVACGLEVVQQIEWERNIF